MGQTIPIATRFPGLTLHALVRSLFRCRSEIVLNFDELDVLERMMWLAGGWEAAFGIQKKKVLRSPLPRCQDLVSKARKEKTSLSRRFPSQTQNV